MYCERLAPELVKSCDSLWPKIYEKPGGKYLKAVKSHLFSHAIHFNMNPSLGHQDKRSLWSGMDIIAVGGKYEGGLLRFAQLGCAFPSRPGDLFFIRGAGLYHQGTEWNQGGRMVYSFFADKNAFHKSKVH